MQPKHGQMIPGQAFVMAESEFGPENFIRGQVRPHYVYMARFVGPNAPERRGRHLIKIGLTSNPHMRVQGLASQSPFHVMALWKNAGDRNEARSIESGLHSCFAPFRVRGEWFEFHDDHEEEFGEMCCRFLGEIEGNWWRISSTCALDII